MEDDKGLYARAHKAFLDKILPTMDGVNYMRQDMYSLIGLQNKPEHADYKKAFNDVIYNVTHVNKDKLLVQDGKYFRKILKDAKEIQWWIDSGKKIIDFKWPRGVIDDTSFGFEDSIEIYPGDGIHVTGEGNQGKTTWALNVAVENIDNPAFDGVTIFTTEFNDLKFRNRIARFDWVDIWDKEKDRPKFELLPSSPHYEDLIALRPNNLIIIEWIKMEGEAYKIREKIEKLLVPLDRGVLVILSQKRTYKQWGEGGEGGMDLISAGFFLMFEKLWVEKVKAPKKYDPNHKWFGFEIHEGGSKFSHIREIIKCTTCHGKKFFQGEPCATCHSIGFIDK